MKKVISFASDKQNFLKIISVDKAFKKYRKEVKHQICMINYEEEKKYALSTYDELDFPRIHHTIDVGENTPANQTANTLLEAEKVLLDEEPNLVILSGDSDALLAVALAASKMKIPIANLDSGLRCFDADDQAETIRILIDVLCEYYFISEHSAMKNLRDEGKDNNSIFFSGNSLMDILEQYWSDMEETDISDTSGKDTESYVLVALQKKENLLDKSALKDIIAMLQRLAEKTKIIWIVPEIAYTSVKSAVQKIRKNPPVLLSPPEYITLLAYMQNADLVLTDSRTVQEETTYLSCQCVTIRKYTERIVTLDVGTNQLVGYDLERAEKSAEDIIKGVLKPGRMPEMWDGKASKRIVESLMGEMDSE